jgi:hypothetical protein
MENISTHAARAIHSDVFRLLVAADACSIQSKVRTQLYEQFMSAQAWIAKAEAIIRKHQSSEYLNLDGLRDFIKSGEKLQGVMVIIDCCEGNLASSAQHPSVADDSNPHTEPSEHQTEAHATSALPSKYTKKKKKLMSEYGPSQHEPTPHLMPTQCNSYY